MQQDILLIFGMLHLTYELRHTTSCPGILSGVAEWVLEISTFQHCDSVVTLSMVLKVQHVPRPNIAKRSLSEHKPVCFVVYFSSY